jgi:Flp pilus assembly protein TadG
MDRCGAWPSAARRRHRLRREDGQTLILVALAFPLLMTMMLLVVDGANLFVQRRMVQNAADAGALAAAAYLPDDPGRAESAARDYVSRNASGATAAVTTSYAGNTSRVEVKVTERVSTLFAKTFGFSNVLVSARAVAGRNVGDVPLVAYAASTGCSAIKITQDSNSFSALWSNGGIDAPGKNNSASNLLLGSMTCSTSNLDDDAFPTPTSVPQRAANDWPVPPPDIVTLRSKCVFTADKVSVGNDWATDPKNKGPGVYCANNDVQVPGSNLDLSGYTFVGDEVHVSGAGDTFKYADAAPRIVFYATSGDVQINNAASGWTGDIYAPNGDIHLTGDGHAFLGFMEAQTISSDSKGVTFVGTGPQAGGDAGTALVE